MNCNHPVDQLMPSLDYKGALYCRKCEMRFKEKNGWYFEWKPEEKGECEHCKMDKELRNPSGFCDHLQWPGYCETCKKANQGGLAHNEAMGICRCHEIQKGDLVKRCEECLGAKKAVPQKPSENQEDSQAIEERKDEPTVPMSDIFKPSEFETTLATIYGIKKPSEEERWKELLNILVSLMDAVDPSYSKMIEEEIDEFRTKFL